MTDDDKPLKIPQSTWGRSLHILGGGASILAREVAGRVKGALGGTSEAQATATMVRQAQQLVETLGQLKGAAMKAGQLLSLEASDILPPEVTDVLRSLHDDAPPMALDQVERILLAELGAERLAQLERLSPKPIASASIGQVHSAFVAGRKVAIKVQFPGVATSIDSDLALLKRAAAGILTIRGKNIPLDEAFAEVARSLKSEVDYRREAKSLLAYRAAFAGDERFYVPELYPELSTHRVLTLEFVEGKRLKEWLRGEADRDERHHFGQQVVELILKEFYEVGLVQTDPNYGNFYYRPEKRQMVLLDFGATQAFSKKFRRDYRHLLDIAEFKDDSEIIAQATKILDLDPREKPLTQARLCDLLRLSILPFHEESQPFDFADASYLESLRTATLTFLNSVEFSPPPKQLIFLNRKLAGMFHLLKDAGVKIDLAVFWRRVQKMHI